MKRLLYLDTLRGIAALMVVIFHGLSFLDKNPSPQTLHYWLTNVFDLGKIGVIIFFAISGFVITWTLSNKKNLRSFWRSRIFRLYPAYWASIFFALVFGGGLAWENIDTLKLLKNLTRVQQFFGFDNILGVYWTLAIEMVFYVTISIVYLAKRYNDKSFFILSIAFLIAALGLALARYLLEKKLPVALPLSLSIMFFSALLQKVVIEKDKKALEYVKKYLVLFIVMIPLISLLAYNKNMGYNEVWYRYTLSYFSAIIIFLWMIWAKISTTLGVYLGRISYSMYLFHPIVMESGRSLLLNIYHSLGIFLAICVLIILVVIVATVIYYLIERPFMQLSKRVALAPMQI